MDIAYQPTTSRPSPMKKINVRLVALLVIAALPFLWFLKVIVSYSVHSGIVDHGSYVEADLKAMGNFSFAEDRDTIDDVPKAYRQLDGKRVMLVGAMYSSTGSNKLDRFQLVYNVAKCCFGGPPKVQERVFVSMPKDKETEYFSGDVRVVGTLRVRDTKDADRTVSLYTMVADSIEPL